MNKQLTCLFRLYFTKPSVSHLTFSNQEWQHQLRTSLHPALFAGAYLVADFISSHILPIGILRASILVAAPQALQAVIAGLGDWYTWQLAVSIYGANSNVSFFAVSFYLLRSQNYQLT
jgi:phosphatidylinositol glycan class B